MFHYLPSPGDLLWWEWLLCALGCGGLATVARFMLSDFLGDIAGLLFFISMAAGVFCALIGIARLVELLG